MLHWWKGFERFSERQEGEDLMDSNKATKQQEDTVDKTKDGGGVPELLFHHNTPEHSC